MIRREGEIKPRKGGRLSKGGEEEVLKKREKYAQDISRRSAREFQSGNDNCIRELLEACT